MNAVKIGKNFLVEPGQFPIQAYGAVSFSLGACVLVGTVGAVFALVELLCPAIAIPLHRDVPQEEELFVIWADKTSVLSHTKINRECKIKCVSSLRDSLCTLFLCKSAVD